MRELKNAFLSSGGFQPSQVLWRLEAATTKQHAFLLIISMEIDRKKSLVNPQILLEAKCGFVGDIRAGETRAPVFLNVRDHKICPIEVSAAGRTLGVVHGVRHIANQGDILPKPHHLPDSERPPEYAHVQVNAAEDDVGDAAPPADSRFPVRRR